MTTSVWGDIYESKEQQSEELSYTVQDSDHIVSALTPDLVSILEQADANATSPFVVEATGRYVLTTAMNSIY